MADTTAPEGLAGASDPRRHAAIAEAVCPRDLLVRDIIRLVFDRFLDGIDVETPLPPGPKVYLTNHQIGFDLLFLSFALAGAAGERVSTIGWTGLHFMQHGEMFLPLIERAEGGQDLSHWINLRLVDSRHAQQIAALLADLRGAARSTGAGGPDAEPPSGLAAEPPSGLVVAIEGTLQSHNTQSVRRAGTGFIDTALEIGLPVVPVRFCHALPDAPDGNRYSWPHRLAPIRVRVGPAIPASTLAGLRLTARRGLVIDAIDSLAVPAPAGHRDRNADMERRVARIVRWTGVSYTKAILIDLLSGADPAQLTGEGRAVRRFLREGPASPLAREAGWLYRYALTLSDAMITTDLPYDDLYGPDVGG